MNIESKESFLIDELENAIDSLETAVEFLQKKDSLKWKWYVIALHHSLYSFCINALRIGDYRNLFLKDESKIIVKKDPNSTMRPKKEFIIIDDFEPRAFRLKWESCEDITKHTFDTKKIKKTKSPKLIGFWSALARCQDEYFWMNRYYCQKAVRLEDDELISIYRFTEIYRNTLIHYSPQIFDFSIGNIISDSKPILRTIEFLVFQSFSINPLHPTEAHKRIRSALSKIFDCLEIESKILSKK